MGTFFRGRHPISYERGFVQGAGRILYAPSGSQYPSDISDIITLTAGATLYDLATPWVEIGFTKTGINITRNNAEEDFDVDQVTGSIRRRPTNWEMSVGTQLAEATLETFQLAWELGPIASVTPGAPQLAERHVGLSAPTSYAGRMIAVLFQFPPEPSGSQTPTPTLVPLIRAWVFRNCYKAAQESGLTLQKTGEQVSLPVRWNAQADPSASVDSQFGEIFEQVPDSDHVGSINIVDGLSKGQAASTDQQRRLRAELQ